MAPTLCRMCHLFGPYGISHAPSRKVVLRFPNSRFQFRSLAVWNPGCRKVVPRFPNSRFHFCSLGVWNPGCRKVVPGFPNSTLQFRSLGVWNPRCRKVVTGFPNSRFQFRSLGVWNPGCGIAVPGFPNSRHLNSNSPTVQPVCRSPRSPLQAALLRLRAHRIHGKPISSLAKYIYNST